jgi:hypothetical protein
MQETGCPKATHKKLNTVEPHINGAPDGFFIWDEPLRQVTETLELCCG